MAKTFDIIIAVNVDNIVENRRYGGTEISKATEIKSDENLIHILTTDKKIPKIIDSNEGEFSLSNVEQDDVINWRAISLSSHNSPNSVVLENYIQSLTPFSTNSDILSNPQLKLIRMQRPIIVSTNPLQVEAQELHLSYWTSKVLNIPNASYSYRCYFRVYNNGTFLGYNMWEHKITLNM